MIDTKQTNTDSVCNERFRVYCLPLTPVAVRYIETCMYAVFRSHFHLSHCINCVCCYKRRANVHSHPHTYYKYPSHQTANDSHMFPRCCCCWYGKSRLLYAFRSICLHVRHIIDNLWNSNTCSILCLDLFRFMVSLYCLAGSLGRFTRSFELIISIGRLLPSYLHAKLLNVCHLMRQKQRFHVLMFAKWHAAFTFNVHSRVCAAQIT